jgi:hypothetical protein
MNALYTVHIPVYHMVFPKTNNEETIIMLYNFNCEIL